MNTNIQKNYEAKSFPMFVLQAIELLESLGNDKSDTSPDRDSITDAEKKFLVCLVIGYTEGIRNYKSSRLLSICGDLLGFSRKEDVTTYLSKLDKKNWVEYNTKEKTYSIPKELIDLDLKENKLQITVELRYNEVVRQSNTDQHGNIR